MKMQVDFSGQQASAQQHSRRKRVAHAALAAMLAGAVSLIFSFAMGLQDAGWNAAWTGVGHAYTLFGSPESGGQRHS
jgi:hypothetical protein